MYYSAKSAWPDTTSWDAMMNAVEPYIQKIAEKEDGTNITYCVYSCGVNDAKCNTSTKIILGAKCDGTGEGCDKAACDLKTAGTTDNEWYNIEVK